MTSRREGAELDALKRLAGRAPSAHNTQPWRLYSVGEGYELGWWADRELPVGDPTRRDLYLSLGAYVEAFSIASAALGVPLRPEIAPDPGRRWVARFARAAAPYATRFTAADLAGRRSARGEYVPGALPETVFADVRAELAGTGAGLWRGGSRALAPLLDDADRWMFGDGPSVGELRRWLRLRKTAAAPGDGLSADALGLSRAQARGLDAVLRPCVYRALRPVGLPRLLAGASRGVLRAEGTVSVLTADAAEPGPAELIGYGRGLLRVWLGLARAGYATHPLSQLIDCPGGAARLAGVVGAAPLAVFRVGRPVAEPVRSRRLTD